MEKEIWEATTELKFMLKEKAKVLSTQLAQQSAQLSGIAKGIQGIGGKVDIPAAGGALSQSTVLNAAE